MSGSRLTISTDGTWSGAADFPGTAWWNGRNVVNLILEAPGYDMDNYTKLIDGKL